MSLLVDPRICPDCRAALTADARCTGCGTVLAGPLAGELWQHLTAADGVFERLRRQSVPAPAAPTAPAPAARPAAPPATPAAPPRRGGGLPGVSVPVLLFGLGALCLLVAAMIFVAVAWGDLSLGVKTLVLTAVTAAFVGAAVWLTRRGLRGAAETFWSVVAAMATLDLVAAHSADLAGLGALPDRHLVGLVGLVLTAIGLAVGAWAPGTQVRRLWSPTVVAAVGSLVVVAAEAWFREAPAATIAAIPATASAAYLLRREPGHRFEALGWWVAGLAAASWLVLYVHGLDRLARAASDAEWWRELAGWPLLVAVGFAATAAFVPRMHVLVRYAAAGAALVAATTLAAGPGGEPTTELLTWSAVLVALAAVSAHGSRVWARPAGVLVVLVGATHAMYVLLRPLMAISGEEPDVASWTAPVTAIGVLLGLAGLVRHLRTAAHPGARRLLAALAVPVLGLGLATIALEHGVEPGSDLWVSAAASAFVLGATAAVTHTVRSVPWGVSTLMVAAGYLLVVGLVLTARDDLVIACFAGFATILCALGYARSAEPAAYLRVVLLAAGFATGSIAIVAGCREAGLEGTTTGIVLAVVATALGVLARECGREELTRLTFEAFGTVVALLGLALVDHAEGAATVLTVLGSGIALTSIRHDDRRVASWAGVAVLGAATFIRIVEEVRLPELYTLPAALLLIGVGVHRLLTDAGAGSPERLGPGLTLALVPSLLLALEDPITVRGALLAAAGVLALGTGLVQRWSAPTLAGAVTVGLLAVRHLGPVVDAVPRWATLATLGVGLLVVGVTWESRLRDLRRGARYLAALR